MFEGLIVIDVVGVSDWLGLAVAVIVSLARHDSAIAVRRTARKGSSVAHEVPELRETTLETADAVPDAGALLTFPLPALCRLNGGVPRMRIDRFVPDDDTSKTRFFRGTVTKPGVEGSAIKENVGCC